ncbi:MAG: hypothetical protein K5880_13905 [Hydrogenophaga sp.]|uniref:hypothetical protein n=1 Tax=Hydrogenophaga sp. TaxID=1904254 RepID=UPI002638567E|nr:hypothetical protein [Hydrogenophaga sp.]MCV0439716.1 hypothetical protein [Hydrogenophaga sp.]
MNQRSKRARDRKRGQDIGASTMHTGGHVAAHRRGADPVVRTPLKATGDIQGDKAQGLAKASPFFKKLGEIVKPKSKEEEKQVIASATEDPVGEAEQESQEEETQEESQEETTE